MRREALARAGGAVAAALVFVLIHLVPSGGLAGPAEAPPDLGDATEAAAPPVLPDPDVTPGATLPVTVDDICTPGYSTKVRNVPASVKRRVYAEYGIGDREPGEYEVDHLISLQLGGSNSIRNLWPESYRTEPWNAHVKDRLEGRLHRLVCSGRLDLETAQRDIATDWIAAYQKYLEPPRP